MKFYKNLYLQAAEEAYYWKKCYYELQRFDELKQKEKEVEPYHIEVYLKNGKRTEFENAINHKIDNDSSCVYYEITTADGLVSAFKYDEVKYIIAYRV